MFGIMRLKLTSLLPGHAGGIFGAMPGGGGGGCAIAPLATQLAPDLESPALQLTVTVAEPRIESLFASTLKPKDVDVAALISKDAKRSMVSPVPLGSGSVKRFPGTSLTDPENSVALCRRLSSCIGRAINVCASGSQKISRTRDSALVGGKNAVFRERCGLSQATERQRRGVPEH